MSSPSDAGATADLDPRFVFDFLASDDPDDDQRFSTWLDVEPLCRGPEPLPDWVVTDRAAVDTELGILKTGKEADVFLLERAVPGDPAQQVVMAAKRYRGEEHRTFHRSAAYT
jgi:RIO kinase 1